MTLSPPSASARKHTATSDSTATAKTSKSETDAALSMQTGKPKTHSSRIFTRRTRTTDDSAGTNTFTAANATHTPSAVNQPTSEVTVDRSDSSGKQRAPRLPAATVREKPSQPTQVVNDSPT